VSLVDIAVNFSSPQLREHIPAILERASSAGLVGLVAVGTSELASREAFLLAKQYPGTVLATAGVHPHYASSWNPEVAKSIEALLAAGASAVGECGLDYFRMLSPREMQLAVFRDHLALAVRHRLPLYLHCRDAFADFFNELDKSAARKGVVHCFTGGRAEAEAILRLGFDIGITGWLCDARRAGALVDAVRHIPLGRLHLETDAPYLYPALPGEKSYRKTRNEPCYLPRVAAEVAKVKGVGVEAVAAACTENSRRMFGIPC
jgi:TatD DNase family protein